MRPSTALVRVLTGLVAGILCCPACAEKADREKPANLEADKVTVDDKNKVHVFEGNVQFSQGTLLILADRIVLTQDAGGFQKGVAHGQLAKFRQKRDGSEEYVEGEAERIEHDSRSEQIRLFNRAWVKSGRDEVRGQFISYDALTEQYVVTSGPEGTVVKSTPERDTRVRVVIQPRGAAPAAPSNSAPGVNPRQE